MSPLLTHWQSWINQKTLPRPLAGEPPLRAELFSVEQLARHAKILAGYHQVITQRGANDLLDRLGQNEKILRAFNAATLVMFSPASSHCRVSAKGSWTLTHGLRSATGRSQTFF